MTPAQRQSITGLILAGGRSSRMGADGGRPRDKALMQFKGKRLVDHVFERIAPQVGGVMINANQNHDQYKSFGVRVVSDAIGDYAGPLAGWLAGLEHCETPYMLTVPCDTPQFPLDLAVRLAQALAAADADIAMAATQEDGRVQVQPVFCLLKTTLIESLVAYLAQGQRKIDQWTALHPCTTVVFDDAQAFFNANTAEELRSLSR